MNSFWKARLWVWIAILIVLWTAFQGPDSLFSRVDDLPRFVGYAIGSLVGLSFWILVLEVLYRLITWPSRRRKKKL